MPNKLYIFSYFRLVIKTLTKHNTHKNVYNSYNTLNALKPDESETLAMKLDR